MKKGRTEVRPFPVSKCRAQSSQQGIGSAQHGPPSQQVAA
jgi:hypothetical protein